MACSSGCSGGSALDGMDPVSREVLLQFRWHAHLKRQLLQRTLGLSPIQAECLAVLGEHDSITQRDFGEYLHFAPATLTAMLQRLERQGLIVRWADERDQRLMRLRLSEAGHVMRDRILNTFHENIQHTLGAFSGEDRAELARILRLLCDHIAGVLETAKGRGSLARAPQAADDGNV